MKKTFVFSLLFLVAQTVLFAQQESNEKGAGGNGNTSFYAELGGPGLVFSANLDKRFNSSHLGWGGRAGIGFASISEERMVSNPGGGLTTEYRSVSIATFPIQVNYIFGKAASPHTFEVGAGATFTGRKIEIFDFYDENRASTFGTASFMYRRQPANGGFTWRIGFTPIFAKGYIQPFAGAGVGYNF
jgi:hypothetical protein